MKSTPRPRRQQARQPQQAAASFASQGHLAANAWVIRAGKTKYGPRSGGKQWYAQVAILALYPDALPKHVNYLKLARDVDVVVRRDHPQFVATHGKTKEGRVIGPMTVRRALKKLCEANS